VIKMIIPIISLDSLLMITHSGSGTPNDDQKHPSSDRYEKRYELLDLNDLRRISEGKVNLLNTRLRQSLFQHAAPLSEAEHE
jgi:hypothetical protein